ncbi:MAG: 3-hydroxyacyl-CoA dehydrogenase family protein [Deltaproteobacteria bacterium]|nr:3-hydroxyacyl-CoA dehydrogenase family protein [Deltaproteobacteria bacterium]
MAIHSIGIIGAGVIGSSWAAFYASKGLHVKLYDIDPAFCREGRQRAREYIGILENGGLINKRAAAEALSLIKTVGDLEEAGRDVGMIQECVAEKYEVKHQVFEQLDAVTDMKVILASSSSGLLMTEIQKVTRHPERCVIAHPFNPPHLIPLVEVVPGEQTSDKTVLEMKAFLEGVGKIPVVLKKEAFGHVANRLAWALWREAIDIVWKGIASVEDVDKALYAGLGLRWAFMGQHLIYHLNGGDGGMEAFFKHLGPACEEAWQGMDTWTTFPLEAKEALIEGIEAETEGRSVGELAKWRDEKLVQLIKTLYPQEGVS